MYNRVSARVVVSWIAAAQAIITVVAVALIWVQTFYHGDLQTVAALSYPAAEPPPVPSIPWQLGAHTFGDFLLPFEQALAPNPWIDYTLSPNPYPSFLVTVFKVLSFFPYTTAIGLFYLATLASMAVPIGLSARRLSWPVAIVAICAFGLLSFPFLMVLDRGNAQGLIVFPLYLFSTAWRSGHWRQAVIALTLCAALKIYPIVLAIALLAERRYRDAAVAAAATIGISIFFFSLYPGGLGSTIHAFLLGTQRFSTPVAAQVTYDNYSIVGMIANFAGAFPNLGGAALDLVLHAPFLAGFAYLAAVCFVVFSSRIPFVIRMACAMSTTTLIVPVSYGYSLAFVIVVVSEVLRLASIDGIESELPLPLAIALAAALACTIAEWPYKLATGSSIGTILVPLSWTVLTVVTLVFRYGPRQRRTALAAAA